MKRVISIISFVFITSLFMHSQNIMPNDTTKIKVLEYPSSFNELINQFRGKIVYIDVMASWCKPCIIELKESKNLDSYFDENDIVRLYVTIDQKKDIDKCIALLNQYDAKGYFISYLSPQDKKTDFASDIEALFLKNEKGELNISIPKYAIVDREGNIVNKRAERPSNKDALIKQLQEWVDK